MNKIYLCFNEQMFKIGQTTTIISDRMKNIRKTDKNVQFLFYAEFNSTKAELDFIESAVRLAMEKNNYELYGIDHFIKKYSVKRAEKIVLKAITETLNYFKIDFKIVYNKKLKE